MRPKRDFYAQGEAGIGPMFLLFLVFLTLKLTSVVEAHESPDGVAGQRGRTRLRSRPRPGARMGAEVAMAPTKEQVRQQVRDQQAEIQKLKIEVSSRKANEGSLQRTLHEEVAKARKIGAMLEHVWQVLLEEKIKLAELQVRYNLLLERQTCGEVS